MPDSVSVSDVQEELISLRIKALRLEEELDTVALAAARTEALEAENAELKTALEALTTQNQILTARLSAAPAVDGELAVAVAVAVEPLEDPSAPFVVPEPWTSLTCVATVEGVNGGLNVLCARPHPHFPDVLASGGVNKGITFTHIRADGTTTSLATVAFAAPVLSLDFNPSLESGLLAAGLMDGSLQILRLAPAGGGDGSGVGGSTFTRLDPLPCSSGGGGGDAVSTQASDVVHAVAAFRDHAKYVVCARWGRDGTLLATASHDKTVALYSTAVAADAADNNGVAAAASPLRLVTKLYFPEAVEAVEFVGGGASGDARRLVVASREQPHLVYVDLVDGAGYAQARVSVNANAWDAHVSFSVLGLTASPDGRYVLAATDRARAIVYRAGHNAHIRTLVGHAADAYFQPRAAWSPSGLTAFCNSQGAHGLIAYCVAGARVVERAGGHAGAVRDVCAHPTARVLYTASYDKSVKVWTY